MAKSKKRQSGACGRGVANYLNYLKDTLIPDLQEAGSDGFVRDFEEAIEHIEACCARRRK